MDTVQNLVRYYGRFYINLDRHKFDMWLVSLIPDHVTIAAGFSCKNIRNVGEFYEITYIQNKAEHKITVKYVIGADGANSVARKTLFSERKIQQYTSIQQWFKEPLKNPSCHSARSEA